VQRVSQLPQPAADGDMSWQDKGACWGMWKKGDTDLFFPPDNPGRPKRGAGVLGEAERVRRARAVCLRCDVRSRCLQFALSNNLTGVWGATTDADRRYLRGGDEDDDEDGGAELAGLQSACREKEET